MTQLSIPAQPEGVYFGVLGNVPADWLAGQNHLTIAMKDGYSFFKANRNMFAERFSDPAKTTVILINNPDTPFVNAIADKDYNKTAESQRNDYMQTVLLIQDIAAEVTSGGKTSSAVLAGFNDVPTDNIFLGDDTLIKKVYPTESYRGPLEGCMVDSTKSNEAKVLFERAAKTCKALLEGQTVKVGDNEKILPPARELLSYQVPEQYRKNDIRI